MEFSMKVPFRNRRNLMTLRFQICLFLVLCKDEVILVPDSSSSNGTGPPGDTRTTRGGRLPKSHRERSQKYQGWGPGDAGDPDPFDPLRRPCHNWTPNRKFHCRRQKTDETKEAVHHFWRSWTWRVNCLSIGKVRKFEEAYWRAARASLHLDLCRNGIDFCDAGLEHASSCQQDEGPVDPNNEKSEYNDIMKPGNR